MTTKAEEIETVDVPLETLADMAFSVGPEVLRNADYQVFLPDGGEEDDLIPIYDLRTNYEYVETITDDERGWGVVFGGTMEFPVSYRVARKTHWHPAEYDTDYYDLPWEFAFFPGDCDGFASATFEVGL